MFPIANVDEYKGMPDTSSDTTHSGHWMQAYYAIYNAAYNPAGWISPDALNNLIKTNGNSKQHPTGISYYQFNSLDTNVMQDHLADTLANGVLEQSKASWFNQQQRQSHRTGGQPQHQRRSKPMPRNADFPGSEPNKTVIRLIY
ncbi:MAG TPA: hypothetical protein PKV73_14335 [Agriterribacter sp.]|nr:hypothetical protein [Chitinophagaceae bacterium]HRP33072.1 hypothetical protein [Agriterribacter sp.]